VVATTANPAMPRRGFGKPNASACGEVITDPQLKVALMLHGGV
jgi:hypothetical protein